MSEAYLVVLEEKVRLAARRSRTDGRLAAQRRGQGHAEAAQEAMASGATAAGRLAGLGPSLFSRNRQTRFCPLGARVAPTVFIRNVNAITGNTIYAYMHYNTRSVARSSSGSGPSGSAAAGPRVLSRAVEQDAGASAVCVSTTSVQVWVTRENLWVGEKQKHDVVPDRAQLATWTENFLQKSGMRD